MTSAATGGPLERWCRGDQGFGNVGAWAAEIYTEQGGIVTTVSDASGALHNDAGLDIVALRKHLAGGWKLTDYPNGAPHPFLCKSTPHSPQDQALRCAGHRAAIRPPLPADAVPSLAPMGTCTSHSAKQLCGFSAAMPVVQE